ncbi:MAG: hypothetical protein F4Z79_03040 [Acidimicrobiia bacterium]|nr:hypothetical protein [bacterium]MXX00584.1 hypothetical protein [Acidimicrobiia bacterium]MYB78323.1 hypothetical protein [Acidimicrobiia bacterium]MYG92287.1 hypothetical protein [Acidimicrobiia bacterium]
MLLLALAGFIILVVRLVRRVRPRPSAQPEPDPLAPVPNLHDLSVSGDAIQVTFGVPMVEDDPILADLLCYYALEAVRRARQTLPLEGLGRVEVFVLHREESKQVGSVDFEEPGKLPENFPVPEIVGLAEATRDPLDSDFVAAGASATPTPPTQGEALAPLAEFLTIPAKVSAALRLQGVDPADMTAGALVRAILALRGYTVSPGPDSATFHARKGVATVMVREVPHPPDGHPELTEGDMRRFVMDMAGSRMARGMLVTEKYGPFSVYEWERRDSRIRFVTRERLQKAIDALALG